MIKPGSCSRGFRSSPSTAEGINRPNGFEVKITNIRKPEETSPSTARVRARKSSGKFLLNSATAKVHRQRINSHRSNEPSCEPHTAENRYSMGNCQLLFRATYSTEKSCVTNAQVRAAKAVAISKNCAVAPVWPTFIRRWFPVDAPIRGRMPMRMAINRAPIRVICPISGIIQRSQLSSFEGITWPDSFRASATSGGMYFSSCLASTSDASNRPDPSSEPRAITP